MIAIYDRPGSFSDRWKARCDEIGISYISVDIFSDDLFCRLKTAGVTGLLCHPPMFSRAANLAAKTIIHVCTVSGIKVFPQLDDYWHFDDKIAQKYIFEALDIPRPDTRVFFEIDSALSWLQKSDVPVVVKLKSGAGSINVSLIKNISEGEKYIRRMFGRGVPATDHAVKDLVTKVRNHRAKRDWVATLKRLPTTLGNLRRLRKDIDWERGYCYFQEFVDNNDHDTRVTVIGDRAFAFRRGVRPGDFRASGSNMVNFDPAGINLACIELAFKAAKRLRVSCIAFDFIERSIDASPLIVEMSFAFKPEAVLGCPGHWRPDLSWQEGSMWPQDAILEDFLSGTQE